MGKASSQLALRGFISIGLQCITNFVSMDIMANTLLAAGASPAMAHAMDEVEDFVAISSGKVSSAIVSKSQQLSVLYQQGHTESSSA
jgi:hypothetical protein